MTKMSLLGGLFIITLAITDRLIVSRSSVQHLIYMRILVAIYFIAAAYISRTIAKNKTQPWSKKAHSITYAVSTFIPSMVITKMIYHTGAYNSPYHLAIVLSAIIFTHTPCFSPIALITLWATHSLFYPTYIYASNPSGATYYFYTEVILQITIITAITILRYRADNTLTNNYRLQYKTYINQEKLNDHAKDLDKRVREQKKQIRNHLKRLDTLWHATTDALILTDQSGQIIGVNNAATRMLECQETDLTGKNMRTLIKQDETEILVNNMQKALDHSTCSYEMQHYTKNYQAILCDVTATAFETEGVKYIQFNLRDITTKRKHQKYIAQAERLESVAIAAAGIAHDFKNTLQAAATFVELTTTHPGWETLDTIAPITNENIMKARDTIERLIELTEPKAKSLAPYNLNEIARKVHSCTKYLFKRSRVMLTLNLAPDIPQSLGNQSEIQDALINLIVNAKDATPQGGKVTVTTSLISRPSTHLHTTEAMPPDTYLCLEVADNGTGIPNDIIDKIYSPYFTTKKRTPNEESGSGLGLFNVYTTVKAHNGTILLDTHHGSGTTFTILLPVTAPRQQANQDNRTAVQ